MRIVFEKYHGTGNDFIMLDIRNHAIQESPDIIAQMCDRHFGIGADGLIMLNNAAKSDFSMRYFNADGHESSMCGNGGRCITAFAKRLGMINNECIFDAIDGTHRAIILSQAGNVYEVSLQMADVEVSSWEEGGLFLDTGSPHFIQLREGIEKIDVDLEGRKLRNDPMFSPGGANVNFIEEKDGILHIRTYERGVEAETLSCGTGVTAAALAWAIRHQLEGPVKLQSPGGQLKVHFNKTDGHFSDIFLEGPATYVYSGEIEI